MDNQAQEAHEIKDLMKVQMEKEGVFQAQILEMTQAMATMQKQMDERITRINTQIQVVLTQNFELHDIQSQDCSLSCQRLFVADMRATGCFRDNSDSTSFASAGTIRQNTEPGPLTRYILQSTRATT